MSLYDQTVGSELPSLTAHSVGSAWRLWVEGTFNDVEMFGDPLAVPNPIPPKMEWGAETKAYLIAMKAEHHRLGEPQKAQYFTLVEGILVAWGNGPDFLTESQGDAALGVT